MKRRILRYLPLLTVLLAIPPMTGNTTRGSQAPTDRRPAFPPQIAGTKPAETPANILDQLHEQIDRYWLGRIAETPRRRENLWRPNFASLDSYAASVKGHRQSLVRMLGLTSRTANRPTTRHLLTDGSVRVEALSIPVDGELDARALLFVPAKPSGGAVIAIPPAEGAREDFAGVSAGRSLAPWLRTLLTKGITVAVPTTIEDAADHPWAKIAWNSEMTRRRFLHRLAFPVGRTVTGLEVEQVLAVRDYLEGLLPKGLSKVALLGQRQGGMTALYAAAVDERFSSVAVVDYFQQREGCWEEPVDRMLYGQLNEFGDAEVAALIAPRPLSLYCSGTGGCDTAKVEPELLRARRFYDGLRQREALTLERGGDALSAAAARLAVQLPASAVEIGATELRVAATYVQNNRDVHFDSIRRYLRRLIDESTEKREAFWRLEETQPSEREAKTAQLVAELKQLMGVIQTGSVPMNPRTRLIQETEDWAAYDVLLDVVSGVEAWGYLLIPKEGQGPFPVVIAQHGGGGTPGNVTGIGETKDTAYHEFARHLAEHGYVVFAPMVAVGNQPFPEARDSAERVLSSVDRSVNPKVRKAAALGLMRTSLEQAKLRRIIDFLETLDFVDAKRIGYYGLSYGGYAATWMTAQEPRIQATIISGHFNDWTPKITAEGIATSYLRHPDEDFSNWDVLHKFTHTELVAAMWPRAVCVEYGEGDAVTPPGWARTAWRRLRQYAAAWDAKDRIVRVYFDGNHEIHGVHAVDFLDRWLRPENGARRDYAFKPPVRERAAGQAAPSSGTILHELDTSAKNRIVGAFFVAEPAPVFSGIAIQAARTGNPGDLIVRFGTAPGSDDVALARVPSSEFDLGKPEWVEAKIRPVRLTPGVTYYFEIAPEWGWRRSGDYYNVAGPKPLGGSFLPPEFGLFYRALVSGPESPSPLRR